MTNETKYVHEVDVHNLTTPEQLVPMIMKLFNPSSVIDVGCGIGTWLSIFKKHGVKKILGIDGDYVNRELLAQHICLNEFIAKDISLPFNLRTKYDVAICLEVAEHLQISVAEIFIESLCNHSDIIIFAAAVPNQGGQNHVNEQWPEYWVSIFKNQGFVCYDLLRHQVWDNENVYWWYKQNILVFSKNALTEYMPSNSFLSIIHPLHFQQKIDYLSTLNKKCLHLEMEVSKWENANQGIKKHWSKFLQALINKFLK